MIYLYLFLILSLARTTVREMCHSELKCFHFDLFTLRWCSGSRGLFAHSHGSGLCKRICVCVC